MYLIGFPLLVIPFAIYNMIAFLTPGIGWTDKVASIHLMSGKDWTVTTEDILLVVAILLLTLEILKATRMSSRAIVDHILSMILFIAMLAEFLLVAPAGTSTFFLLTVLLNIPMSHQAAAIVLTPIALQTALQFGLNPRTFAIMIAFSPSNRSKAGRRVQTIFFPSGETRTSASCTSSVVKRMIFVPGRPRSKTPTSKKSGAAGGFNFE